MAKSPYVSFLSVLLWCTAVFAQVELPTLEEVKATGAIRSNYRNQNPLPVSTESPHPNLEAFRGKVEPILRGACFQCHGPDEQEGNFRIDSLDPDLIHGGDADWWLEVIDVLSNSEMPPESEGGKLADQDRSLIIDWLSTEIQVASEVRRSKQGHSSFRRMTRYEYNYALQDLLGLPYDFAKTLPPDTASEDGFLNSSEMLQISASQLEQYRELGFNALEKVTLRGARPEPLFYGISMERVIERLRKSKGGRDGGVVQIAIGMARTTRIWEQENHLMHLFSTGIRIGCINPQRSNRKYPTLLLTSL